MFFVDPIAQVGTVMLGEIKGVDEGRRAKQQESSHFNPPILSPGWLLPLRRLYSYCYLLQKSAVIIHPSVPASPAFFCRKLTSNPDPVDNIEFSENTFWSTFKEIPCMTIFPLTRATIFFVL